MTTTFTAKVKEEFEALLPPMIFFFVALHIVAFTRALVLKGTGIPLATSLSVTLGAAIIAKAVLIADMLPLINRYPDKPLAYNIVWKTTIYAVIATFIHYLERLFDVWRETDGLRAANDKLLAEMVWPHFWAVQILLVTLILLYCTLRELARALGPQRVRQMFLGPMPRAADAPAHKAD